MSIDRALLGGLGILGLIVCMAIGMPIALAAMLVGFVGMAILVGPTAAVALTSQVNVSHVASYSLSVLPLFIIMGIFAFRAGVAQKGLEAARTWVGHIRGGEALATTFASAAFGACSGSTGAATAVFSKLSIPIMLERGYSKRLAAGVVAATGTFAAMIPPSALMVVYAVMVEGPVGQQLMAGIIPGIITAIFYAIQLYIWITLYPKSGGTKLPKYTFKERFAALQGTWIIAAFALVIIGGIYSGVFTPTESGAVAAVISFIYYIRSKQFSRKGIFEALEETIKISCFILLIIAGFVVLSRFIAYTQVTYKIGEWIIELGLNKYTLILALFFMYLVLGMFVGAAGMMLLTLPVVVPVLQSFDISLVWYGVFLVKNIEIADVTPPFGFTSYVVAGTCPQVDIWDVFRGGMPFILADVAVLVLITIWPEIALFLPNAMAQ